MNETKGSPTKVLFDSLTKLYKQGQLLLMDADRLMGEHGWEPIGTTAPAEFSYSINSPDRWFARWAVRFYIPQEEEDKDNLVDSLLFVSIHFASDHDTSVNEPLVSAGHLFFTEPLLRKKAKESYDYWICKSWFFGKPLAEMDQWHEYNPSKWFPASRSVRTFSVLLYEIKSSETLEKLVIDKLFPG